MSLPSTQSSKPFLFFRVSILSHVCICSKRAKSESFSRSRGTIRYKRGSAMAKGSEQHAQYKEFIVDGYTEIVKDSLNQFKVNGAFQKVLELPECYAVIRGDYDDVAVLRNGAKKLLSFIEIKTTGKKYMWSLEVLAAIKQLQIYLWLLKDLCKDLEFEMWKRHWLKIYSQTTGLLMRQIPVEYDDHIEEWIADAVHSFMGLAPMKIAPYRYCLLCSTSVKKDCDYFQIRKGDTFG